MSEIKGKQRERDRLMDAEEEPVYLPEDSRTIRDPENEGTVWLELPDNLRLKFVDGRYAGWYTPKLEEALG